MLVGLVSAKGSPGVTTAALSLSAATGGVLVELDPSGGSVECWTGSAGEPALVAVASGLRRHVPPDDLVGHAHQIIPGVRGLLAPTSGPFAESTVAAVGDRMRSGFSHIEATMFVDGGRWAKSQPTARRLAGCAFVAVVCTPTVEGVEAARWIVDPLRAIAPAVGILAIGLQPYSVAEIGSAIDAPVLGALSWDPRGLAVLLARGPSRAWMRCALARSARAIATEIERFVQPSLMATDASEAVPGA